MLQLIYISSATKVFTSEELKRLLKQSRSRNLKQGITGILIYSGHSFMQVLEGSEIDVRDIYASILTDPRNTGNFILFEQNTDKRLFLQWQMQLRELELNLFNDLYGLFLNNKADFIQKLIDIANDTHPSGNEFNPNTLPFFKEKEVIETPFKDDFFRFSTEVGADEVFLMRDDSSIVYANYSACQKLGYTNQELIGMYVWEWDPLFPKESWPGFWGEFIKKKRLHFETKHKKKSGEIFPVEIHAHLYIQDGNNYALAFVNDISQKKHIEAELLNYKIKLEKIIESRNEELKKTISKLSLHKQILDTHCSVAITNADGTITYVNNKFCELSGYSKDELLGANHRILISNYHDRKFYENMYQTIIKGNIWKGIFCNKAKDDHLYWIDTSIIPKLDKTGKPFEYYSVCTDITARKLVELTLENKEKQFRTILELAGDGIHILDKDGFVIECSESFAKSLGYTKEEALKLNVLDWDAKIPKDQLFNILRRLLDSAEVFETRHKRKNGSVFDVEINAKGIVLGGQHYVYASSRDITERLKTQRKIVKMANFDQLTGLANRHKLLETFENYLQIARRDQKKIILILADMDSFKHINDTYGHLAGDAALKHVAEKLKKKCRPYDIAARIGGDEFAVLIFNAELSVGIRYIEQVCSKIKNTFLIHEHPLLLNLSIGVAMFPDHAQSIDELFRKADLALYQSKKDSKVRYCVFRDYD
ncbi:PAS domain S-box protein [Legionella longbeachae]|uniref:Putative regulatory protein (GGDEF domain) n=1 Tax=Legionella longbeachae serogroup 1 (strain NSW150) TaxID=661367 RepID=D3HJ09_LEGLN|nr:PAS domain S-box protein [Legionella longbeachae]VEE02898.1 regulatory protein (GGDEF domain) [Legionella oakridgensis]HBD7398898.1 PAS domain S-box protein [Legionella pneumophila]ARB90860.1 PAS domain S-box protein [Legionella longbeachae]ARM32714.1 PAS domain S-box protein [Legionella longbeachae]QEY51887.1 PAS domain S-box protein [Legionella longbeachae]